MRPKTSLRSLARLLSSLLVLSAASLASPGAAQRTASTPEASGAAIARQLFERNLGYGDVSAELELVLRSERGEESRRALRLRMLERREEDRGDLSLLLFDSPADVRGTALLSHAGVLQGDEQWLYLPAARRVRRISGSSMSSAFLGSEFSYEDITGGEVGKYSWRLLREAPCPGAPAASCFEVETRPRYEGSGYTRRVLWIEIGEHRVRQIDFFDRRDAPLKTLTYEDYRQYGRHWRAHRWTMTNLQTRRSTVLTFREYRFGNGFDESDFTPAALERAR